jgi:phosphate transport system substrate-binding protein
MKNKMLWIGILVLVFGLTIAGCETQNPNADDFVGIKNISFENYPIVLTSTSTSPLNYIIAAKLLSLEYEWIREGEIKAVQFKDGYEISGDFLLKFPGYQTHDSIIFLIDKRIEINDNRIDLIIVARKMSADEKQHADNAGVTLIETPIALDALDFILNSQNPVNSLSVKQIQDIYLGNIVNWSEVGGANEAIVPYIRNPNSGSQEMMNEIVMKDTGILDWEVSFSDEEAIGSMIAVYSELRDNIYGICFTPHYYKEYMVPYATEYGIKTLAVNGITPDKTTIGNKTYPFVADVYASIRSDLDHNSMAYKLYEWLQTKSGKDTIKESGYVPN